MLKIDNLTHTQVKLLDTMWSLDTDQEFKTWYYTLDKTTQKEVDILAEMLYLAEADEIVNKDTGLTMAKQMLGNMGIEC